jgi:anti-sigma factor RsiW
MTCDQVRLHLLDYQQGRLQLETQGAVRAHLDGCAQCTRVDAIEQELTRLLEQRLPQHPASLALKRRLAAQWAAPVREPSRWTGWRVWLAPALAAAAMGLAVAPFVYYERVQSRVAREQDAIVAEAVNDHLRLLASQRPLEVESGGLHQVKPWFGGRLDFAPVVTFEGDAEFPLKGGSVAYFRDRKAAVFAYARRLHPISLLVFRADGLPWPTRNTERIGGVDATATAERGFNVIIWRRGELGYALVSDVERSELRALAARLVAGS